MDNFIVHSLRGEPARRSWFGRWLARRHYQETGGAAGSQAVQDALGVLEGRALYDGEERLVAVRLAPRPLLRTWDAATRPQQAALPYVREFIEQVRRTAPARRAGAAIKAGR